MRKSQAHNVEFLEIIHRIYDLNGILRSPINGGPRMRIAGIGLIIIGFIDVACHWIFQINIYEQLHLNMPDWLYPYSPAGLFVLGTAMVTTAEKNKKLDESN